MPTAAVNHRGFGGAARWTVIVLSSILLLSACTATATVEVSDAVRASESSDPTAAPDTTQTDTDNDPDDPDDGTEEARDNDQDDDADETTDESAATSPPDDEAENTTGADGARFIAAGSLPMDTALVNSLIEFVEQDTGRPFLRPPVIVAQTSDEFFLGLTEASEDDDDPAGDEAAVRTLQALGLTDKGVAEVIASVEALTSEPGLVLGYYNPETDELFLPGESQDGTEFQAVLVHELTHALDGQYADLNILEAMSDVARETGDYEPINAVRAVIEGRASSVESRWRIENDAPEEVPEDLGVAEDVPPAILLALGIPYIFGEQFIELNGGAAATWDAIENPPSSSEEFIAIGTPPDEPIVDVPVPAAEGPVLEELVFGATDVLSWLLGESLEPDASLIFPTITAVDGWAGGRSVLWGDETESCIRIALAGDSPTDLAEIEQAIQLWADDDPDRTVEIDGDLVVATGCAPYVP